MAFVNLISFAEVWVSLYCTVLLVRAQAHRDILLLQRLSDFRLIEVALGSNSILGAL